MKILDLLEDPYQSIKKDINLNRDIKSNPKNKSDYDAKGYFSTVKDKKNDPFIVRKTSNHFIDKDLYRGDQYDAKEHDGYWEFIDDIITHPELKNNPFFPRVYNIKTIIDKSGKKVYRADLYPPR